MCDRAIELAAGDPTVGANITNECPLAQCLMQKGGILSDLGRLDEAGELIERGGKIATEQHATETIGWAHNWGNYRAFLCGEAELAMAHAQQTVEIAGRIGDAFSRTWSWVMVGLAATMLEDWQQALDAIDRADAVSSERRAAADSEGWGLMIRGQAHLGLGDPERAVELCREGVTLLRRREQIVELIGNIVLARVLLAARGLMAREEIEAALARAEELVGTTGALGFEPMIHVERAELARQNGDQDESGQELREAHRLFTQI